MSHLLMPNKEICDLCSHKLYKTATHPYIGMCSLLLLLLLFCQLIATPTGESAETVIETKAKLRLELIDVTAKHQGSRHGSPLLEY